MDSDSYVARAVAAGPRKYSEILVAGANDYSSRITSIVTGSPYRDLPLIVASLEIAAKLLRGQMTNPGFVDTLIRILTTRAEAQAFMAKVPKPKEEQ